MCQQVHSYMDLCRNCFRGVPCEVKVALFPWRLTWTASINILSIALPQRLDLKELREFSPVDAQLLSACLHDLPYSAISFQIAETPSDRKRNHMRMQLPVLLVKSGPMHRAPVNVTTFGILGLLRTIILRRCLTFNSYCKICNICNRFAQYYYYYYYSFAEYFVFNLFLDTTRLDSWVVWSLAADLLIGRFLRV